MKSLKTSALALAIGSAIVDFANASPWIGTIEPDLHRDVQTLVDYGYVNVSAVTYPLPWKGIDKQLALITSQDLSPAAEVAYQRLRHYLSIQKDNPIQQRLSLTARSEEMRFKDFGDPAHHSGTFTVASEGRMGRFAYQVSANWRSGGERDWDNSFAAIELGDWHLRAGAVDQWWGPGQSQSLIMSDNARPIPAVSLSRASASASEGWLKWLGPWYVTAQVGQLESERAVPDARVWLSRATIRPIDGLDIGVAWSAMWGGQGQPGGMSTLFDILTFRAECADGSDSCNDALDTKLGNQIAGYDIRYRFQLWETPISLYLQDIGEDADSMYSLTDSAKLVGVSSYAWGSQWFLEHSSTYVACADAQSTIYNCYYEHSVYQSGYRYHGRAIGSSYDSDAEVTTFGMQKHFANGDKFKAALSYASLNRDEQRPSPVVEGSAEDLWRLRAKYSTVWLRWLLDVGLEAQHSKMPNGDTDSRLAGEISATWSF